MPSPEPIANTKTSPGDRFLARQAILDTAQNVFAYELFFRSGLENYFPAIDGDMATSRIIADSFLVFGIEELTGKTRAFINFPQRLLVEGAALLLPREKVVIEILETVRPDPDVIAACQHLKSRGYALALDDFVSRPECEPLLKLADIVKVDFRTTPPAERARLALKLKARGIRLLAEKVETPAEHEEGLRLGYELFQGYYFSRPTLLSRRDMSSFKVHYLSLLKQVNAPELEIDELARVIQSDVGLSLKLLRYINSAAIGLRHQVTSIPQSLFLLGHREVRRWASLLALTELASDKPAELMRSALFRARFAELLARRGSLHRRAADLFLLGLFSLLDAMLDRPLAEILAELPLADDLRSALLGEKNRLEEVLSLVMAQERGDWSDVTASANRLGLDEADLPALLLEAMKFPDDLGVASEKGGGAEVVRTGTEQ